MRNSSSDRVRDVITDLAVARRLARHMWVSFKADRCLDEAASLSYTSLLSLVPLLAVVFGIASAFPVFAAWAEQFKQFLFRNLVPDTGDRLQETLDGFLASVNSLTLPGLIFLILTALLLMVRIEKTFNLIWRVPVPRRLLNKLIMYWAVLTLGPLALGAAVALSAQPLMHLLAGGNVDPSLLRSAGIFLLTWCAFCLTFMLVPNCRVPFAFAALGSCVSTILFTLAKAGFVAFISTANYSVIYGALATLPIFLLWLYLVWAVILLGASLAASLTTFGERQGVWLWPRHWEFLLLFRLLGHLHTAQGEGRTLSTEALLEREPGVPLTSLQSILQGLMRRNIVTQDPEQAWLLKRDLDGFSLRELYAGSGLHLPVGERPPFPTSSPWDAAFFDVVQRAQLDFDHSLASLYGRAGVATTMAEERPD